SLRIEQGFRSRKRLRGNDNECVMGIEISSATGNSMAVDIGNKTHITPYLGIAKGTDSQSHTPIAAHYANMNDMAPAPCRVSMAYKALHALTFFDHLGDGGGGAQHGMPSSAVFSGVDGLAI